MPSVSVVVPVFNGIRYLPYFFESLAKAVPSSAELILVDDASSEPVFEVVPSDLPVASVIKLRNTSNRGYSATVNRGFARATGEIVIQLNTDLILDRDCITAMIALIEAQPRAGVIGSKQLFPTTGLVRHVGVAFGTRRHRHVYAGLPAEHPLCRKTRSMQLVSGATVAMARSVLEEIGPLDERYYNSLENFDHCMKAHVRGYENYTCAESVTYHWVAESGPARFARVDEDEALFWGEWSSSRSVDLHRFVDEALEHLLETRPELADYRFEAICACRGIDQALLLECLQRRWPGIGSRALATDVMNSKEKDVRLPMLLPHRAMVNPAPYIYLVDRARHLTANHVWFETRRRMVAAEVVVDTRAVAITTDELLAL